MTTNWPENLADNRRNAKLLADANPGFVTAFQGLNAAQGSNGALDAKTRELIAIAVAVTTRCEGCIAAHVQAAKKLGITEAELSDALGTAIALNAGAAYTYSVKALDALRQFEAQ